jgi:hypothetical protein
MVFYVAAVLAFGAVGPAEWKLVQSMLARGRA